MQNLVLSVEDDKYISKQIEDLIIASGSSVVCCSNLTDSIKWLDENSPDLILLDIELPDGSGLEMCSVIRKKWSGPIIFVSGHSEYAVTGLKVGGDDYIQKPFNSEELLAKIEAAIRRTKRLKEEGAAEIEVGRLRLDNLSARAFWDDFDLGLKPKEFLVLNALLRANGNAVSAEELYHTVWGSPSGGDVRTVHVHISTLRRKMREGGMDSRLISKNSDGSYVYNRRLEVC